MGAEFPSSPTVGQVYEYNGAWYRYDGAKWEPAGGKGLLAPGMPPSGRLTSISNTPFHAGSDTLATVIYYTPFNGNFVPVWNGSAWVARAFSELALPLDSNTGHTGYHASGSLFDLFVMQVQGALKLVSGPAYSTSPASTLTRTNALARVHGYLTNAVAQTVRFGTGANDIVTMLPNEGLFVGFFVAGGGGGSHGQYAFRNGQAGGGTGGGHQADWHLANYYNTIRQPFSVLDTGATFQYTSTTIHTVRGGTGPMRITFIQPLDEENVDVRYVYHFGVAASTTAVGSGFGVNSITDFFPSYAYQAEAAYSLLYRNDRIWGSWHGQVNRVLPGYTTVTLLERGASSHQESGHGEIYGSIAL